MKAKKSNKGFTLVELIVVIVILAILAAILVPALLGYIDRAKGQQVLVEAKEIMTATQSGIVDAYARQKESFVGNVKKTTAKTLVGEDYDFISSNLLYMQQGGTNTGFTDAKLIITRKALDYIDSQKENGKKKYEFFGNNNKSFSGVDTSTLPKDKQSFIVLYNARGKILYMQYYSKGYLVTYDGKSYEVTNGGKFITF